MNVGALNRRNAARFVLLAWAAALAWLARRELGKDEQQVLAEATIRLNPEAHFYAVTAGGRQIGYASITVDTVVAGFRVSEVMALDVPEAESTRRVTRRTDLVLSRSLRLREFNRTLSGGGLFEQLSGTVADTAIRFRQRDSRERQALEWTLPVTGDVVLPQVLPYRLAFSKRLEVGRSVTANVLDLASGTVSPITFAATAESTFVVPDSAQEQRLTHRWAIARLDTVKAFRIEHQANGTPMVTWVDSHGGLVESEAALGVRLERSAFELVSFNYRSALAQHGPGNLRRIPAMESLVERGLRPDSSAATTYTVTSKPIERFLLPRLDWLAGGRQAAIGSELRIGPPARRAGPRRAEYLDPEPRVPGIDRTIEAAAGIILGSQRDPAARLRLLTAWVAERIAIDTAHDAPSLPTSVLQTKRGGADGHAALLVALARAAGFRARVVGGVIARGDRVYGHAWAEVLMNGDWMPVDPTFGQVPASGRLLRVTVGGSSRAIDLVPVLGSATLQAIPGPVEP